MKLLRWIFVIIAYLVVTPSILAQFCTGTLGANIFLEGDFGNGAVNLLSPNPNIAPGYNYTFNVPPLDGSYVITNNTAVWSGLFGTWLGIGDNSANPNGYMMVINASNEPGLFYEQTISGLCENTLYEFSADIINLIKVGTPDHIDPDVSFLLDGIELFSTGNIPKTNNWTTYGFTFTTQPGQQSLTLSLRNNAPGGNGNDLAIDNISFRACGPETLLLPDSEIIDLCEENPQIELQASLVGNQYANPVFQWQQSFDEGLTWNDISGENGTTFTPQNLEIGIQYYRLIVADGIGNLASEKCRVNSNNKIINVLAKEFLQTETICEGLTLTVGSSTYSSSGTYIDSFINYLGCDSIWITDLTVQPDTSFMAALEITAPCADFADGSISVVNPTGGTPPFSYIFDGVDVGATSIFPGLAGEETYTVVVQDDVGCTIELSTFLESTSDFILELGENQTIDLGQTVNIIPFYNFVPSDFSWNNLTPIDCINFSDCDQLEFQPLNSQQVVLELFAGGCSVSDSIFIEVKEVRDVYIPNAFSPNGDGTNDLFTVFGNPSNLQIVKNLKIFNRWGGLVFENTDFLPNDLQFGWNGTLDGVALETGIYIYTTKIQFIDGKVINYFGDVLLSK